MNTYKVKNIIQALIDDEIDMFPHGCNCFCGFGKGLALSVQERFPMVYDSDLKTIPADVSKLGTINVTEVLPNKFVVNCYTQFHWIKGLNNEERIKKNGRKVFLLANYKAIEQAMISISQQFPTTTRIGIPKIGAGDANGDWDIIEKIILKVFNQSGHAITFYVLSVSDLPAR